jgi:hypothetical protein
MGRTQRFSDLLRLSRSCSEAPYAGFGDRGHAIRGFAEGQSE